MKKSLDNVNEHNLVELISLFTKATRYKMLIFMCVWRREEKELINWLWWFLRQNLMSSSVQIFFLFFLCYFDSECRCSQTSLRMMTTEHRINSEVFMSIIIQIEMNLKHFVIDGYSIIKSWSFLPLSILHLASERRSTF